MLAQKEPRAQTKQHKKDRKKNKIRLQVKSTTHNFLINDIYSPFNGLRLLWKVYRAKLKHLLSSAADLPGFSREIITSILDCYDI